MMYYRLFFYLLLMLPLLAYAEIYQTIDSQGVAHFSDMPAPGAIAIKLTNNVSHANSTVLKVVDKQSIKPDKTNAQAAIKYYQVLKIVQPLNEASLFNNQGEVLLTILVEPTLRAGDQAIVLIDGKPVPTIQYNLTLKAENIERGAHTAQVEIHNKIGQVVGVSNTITFFMHKNSILIAKKNDL